MTNDEIRGLVLASAAKAFGQGYTPRQLLVVEDVWDAALEAAARECEETDVIDARGDTYYAQLGDGRATLAAAAAAIRALKGAP